MFQRVTWFKFTSSNSHSLHEGHTEVQQRDRYSNEQRYCQSRSAGRVAPLCRQLRLVRAEKVMGLDAGSESRPSRATTEYKVLNFLLITLSLFYSLTKNRSQLQRCGSIIHSLCYDWVKIKLVKCLNKHHTVKEYGKVEVTIHSFLTPASDGGEWSVNVTPWPR